MTLPHRQLYAALGLMVLALSLGCEFKGDSGDRRLPQSIDPDKAWQPQPVDLRFYPTTRFVERDGQPVLEARIELLDQMGDTMKCPGVLSFELLEAPNPLGGGLQRRLYSWEGISLLTLEDQRTHYDTISRGYLFHLRLDNFELSQYSTLIKVTFTPVRGERLTDQRVIEPGR